MDPIVFIISLAVLILIHELGHFLAAKKLGMYVEEFAVGFPPKIVGKKIKETLYAVNAIPIGGYVKIFGENEQDLNELEKGDPSYKEKISKAFYAQKAWKRVVVLLAGVAMNFVFGWFVISLVFTRGVAVPSETVRIVGVAERSPAAKAGLRKGDIFSEAAGVKIVSSEKLIGVVDKNKGKKIRVGIVRKGKKLSFVLSARKKPPEHQGSLGVVISDFEEKKYGLIEAPWLGLKESVRISGAFYKEIFASVADLAKGKRPEVEVSGPVGIYNAYRETQGIFDKFLLTGLISLNLALINILPFPALDGGHLLFILIELATGRKLSTGKKQKITYAGLIILLLLLGIVTVKDILRIF